MKRKLMAALAAGAMLGVLWTASPASAAGGNGESVCSFSESPLGDGFNNAGEQIRFFRDLFGDDWIPPGPISPLDPDSGRPAVPAVCNPNGPKL